MRTLYLLVVLCTAAFAQLDSDTITIAAIGQTAVFQPDEVRVWVYVDAIQGTDLAGVLTALAGVPVTERDLISVGQPAGVIIGCFPGAGGCKATTPWTFSFTTPLVKLKETLATLARVAAARQPGISVSYSFSSEGSNAAAPECAYPTLISQARRHAENVAAAAGLRVGAIVAMSDGSGGGHTNPQGAVVAIFDPLTSVPSAWFASTIPAPSPACTAVVQYKLLR